MGAGRTCGLSEDKTCCEEEQSGRRGLKQVLLPLESLPAKTRSMAAVPQEDITDNAEDNQEGCATVHTEL